MKGLYLILILFLSSFVGFAQPNTGDFQSFGTGNWSAPATWSRWDGSMWVNPAPSVPTGQSGITITILSGHNVTSNGSGLAYSLSGVLVINSGGTFTVGNSSASTTDFTVQSNGLITNNGTITINAGSAFPPNNCTLAISGTTNAPGELRNGGTITFVNTSTSRLAFLANSRYNHVFQTTAGVIPNGTNNVSWDLESTCLISGYTTNSNAPTGLNQSFGHFIWNTPGLDLNSGGGGGVIDLNGALTGVRGDLVFESTGGFGDALFLTITTPYTANFIDNFTVNGGFVALTSSADYTLHASENFTIGAGAFFAANLEAADATLDIDGNLQIDGSFDLSAAVGTTGLLLAGNIDIAGEIKLTAGQATVILNGANQSINAPLDFPSPAIVNFTIGNGSTATVVTLNSSFIRTDGNIFLREFSELIIPSSGYIAGGGNFNMDQNSILRVASTDALGAIQLTGGGNIRNTGNRNYNVGSTTLPSIVEYNGTSLQRMGDGHPSEAGVTTVINNAAGVTMVANATIGGLLHLDNGSLSIGSRTLTMNDSFLADAGNSLNVTSSSNIVIGVGDAGPFGTLVTSGSTTINNLSFSRGSEILNIGSNLTINGTLTHSSDISFPGFTFDIKGPYTTTGGSLIGNASSSLIISGSGAITGDISLSGTLGTLTINRPVGVTNTTSVIVDDALNILSGTYQGAGLVTLNPGATLTRSAGTITKSLSVTSYNLVYTNGGAIFTGSELITSPASALNNLTINGGNSVTLNAALTEITVNGTLSLLSGEFVSNGKGVILEGDFVSSGTGTFTNSLVTFAGNTTLSGSVTVALDDVRILTGATLNLGNTVNFTVAGDFSPQSGAIMLPGLMTTFFDGTTTLLIPDENTIPRFNNVRITGSSTLIISCTDCGSENNRPYIEVNGDWKSDNAYSVFNPAPDDSRTAVKLTGDALSIAMLPEYPFWDLRIDGTETATLQTALFVNNDLELEGAKSLSTSTSNFGVTIGGDFLFDGGTFVPNQGTVTFNGTSTQSIDRLSGSGAATFFNINVNKLGGTFSNLTTTEIRNVFTLSSNTAVDFDGPGTDTFTLLSTLNRTASIGPILTPALPSNITGSVIAQRYMHAEGQIFRYISSPVAATASQLQEDTPITGTFTGNNTCASFQPGNPNMFINLESLPGTLEAGYQAFPASSNTEPFVAGRGYSIMVCDGNAQITWDITGAINKGDISLPVTFTSTGSSADGFNLVGNPYPSAIDWSDADWTKTNISSSIYVRDNGLANTPSPSAGGGVYTTYNSATGIGTNGGTKNIAVGQAFWVQAIGASPVLTAREGVKLSAQPVFFREMTPRNLVRMTLVQGLQRDEAVIHFREDATSEFDPHFDAQKMPNEIFNFSTFNSDSLLMTVNTVANSGCSKEFGVDIENVKPGNYQIEFSDFQSFDTPVKIHLIDLFNNEMVSIGETTVYEFAVTDNPLSAGKNRFKIIIGSGLEVQAKLTTEVINSCSEDARIIVQGSQIGVNYFASVNGKKVSSDFSGTGAETSIVVPNDQLDNGTNTVMIFAQQGTCAALPLENPAIVLKNTVFDVIALEQKVICREGMVSLQVDGANDGGWYKWYETETDAQPVLIESSGKFLTPVLSKSKTYYVSAVNSLGCEGPRTPVKAEVIQFQDAALTSNGNVIRSNYASGNSWYFNGELLAGENGQELTMNLSGEYKLEVTLSGGCTTSAVFDHVVTGLEPVSTNFISIFPNPANEKVNIRVISATPVYGELISASGTIVETLKFVPEGNSQLAVVLIEKLQAGFYIVKVKEGRNVTYKKLVKN